LGQVGSNSERGIGSIRIPKRIYTGPEDPKKKGRDGVRREKRGEVERDGKVKFEMPPDEYTKSPKRPARAGGVFSASERHETSSVFLNPFRRVLKLQSVFFYHEGNLKCHWITIEMPSGALQSYHVMFLRS